MDLVQAQIKIAGGAKLSDLGIGEQDSIPPPMGYAIQCRVTCEDPERNFQVSCVFLACSSTSWGQLELKLFAGSHRCLG